MNQKEDERVWGDVGSRLIDGSKVGSDESEYRDFYGKDRGVEDERCHKLAAGLALGT